MGLGRSSSWAYMAVGLRAWGVHSTEGSKKVRTLLKKEMGAWEKIPPRHVFSGVPLANVF